MSKLFTNITVEETKQKAEKPRFIWSSKKIDDYFEKYSKGEPLPGPAPFIDGDVGKRAPNITFGHSQEELEEIRRCASDVVYFANKYASAMTDYGIQKITLRPYQVNILNEFQKNRYVTLLSSRQMGKCHYPLAEINLKIDDNEGVVPFYYLWKTFSKLSFKDRIQFKILDIIVYLSESKKTINLYKLTLDLIKKKHSNMKISHIS